MTPPGRTPAPEPADGADVTPDAMAVAWAAVSDGSPVSRPAADVALEGRGGGLPSRLPTEAIAVASVATALRAAHALHLIRGGAPQRLSLDRRHVALAVRSERFFRVGATEAGATFAPLSRFWPAADGWVRTHANYPWHRDALLSVTGTSDDPGDVAAAIAERPAEELERDVFDAGGIAAAVRTPGVWGRHPQGAAVAHEPLVGVAAEPGAPPRRRPRAESPATGVGVLDLTRVIAGPVCTRYLAALGAEVLRIDPPHRPDMAPGAVADTLLGKRSAFLVLDDDTTGRLRDLVAAADVVVLGYRPGSLHRFGLEESALVDRHPGLVVVSLAAWGHTGPWHGRRGFDSVVQAPTGIADTESAEGVPGALPCQLLDHATGYLAAAAALDGLARQTEVGGSYVRRVSLARTARWLTTVADGARPPARTASADAPDPRPWITEIPTQDASATAVLPPGSFGRPLAWPAPLDGYGTAPAQWPPPSAARTG
jgi:hypothetical protein